MRSLNIRIFTAMSLVFCIASAHAADIQIKMLDKSSAEGTLAFEPGFAKANVNDTLVFIPASNGHNSRSLLVPAGAEPWQSAFDKEFRVTLDKEGVYLYSCDSHKKMGMVGVVQVGNAVNLEEAKKIVAEESARMVMNKDRFVKELEQVQ